MRKKLNTKGKFLLIISILLFVIYSISNIMLIINLIRFNDVENVIRIIVCSVLVTINVLLFWFYFVRIKKKKVNKKLIVVDIIFLIVFGLFTFINYNFSVLYNALDKMSGSVVTDTLSLVAMQDNDSDGISGNVGVISDDSKYDMAMELINKNDIQCELIKYDNYLLILEDLYSGELDYAFLPENYVFTFMNSEGYEKIEEETKVVKNISKKLDNEVIKKDINKPFSILLMGVDTLSSSYNADTLLLLTFNPDTLSTTMLSIPRDTYTRISCTGGKHKINSSGWYSDSCVVSTVGNLVDIDIDYYAKINFTGIVELVDKLGGIDVDVVYPFCEQNSKRQFGSNMIYVEEGFQHLNGEQALALSRNRHFWPGRCPSKYNEQGYYDNNLRNDITRGLNQQLVIKGILNQLGEIKDIDTIYNLVEVISNNVSTNIDKDTMLSFYNIFKKIVSSSKGEDASNLLDMKRLAFEVYGTYVNISDLNLSMIIPHQNSINAVSRAMKENLGLIDKEVIKTISFDINNPYEEKVIGKGIYGGTSVKTLDDMIKKSYDTAKKYCDDNGFNCEFVYKDITDGSYSNNQIISQSIPANYDVSLIGKKKIVFEVAKVNVKIPFDYATCVKKENKDNSKCMVPNFTSKNISEFNLWYKNFGYLDVSIGTSVEGEEGVITSQNIFGKSIYDIISSGDKLSIIYVKKDSDKDNTGDKDPEDGKDPEEEKNPEEEEKPIE